MILLSILFGAFMWALLIQFLIWVVPSLPDISFQDGFWVGLGVEIIFRILL